MTTLESSPNYCQRNSVGLRGGSEGTNADQTAVFRADCEMVDGPRMAQKGVLKFKLCDVRA